MTLTPEAFVREFQRRAGLAVDGIAGPATLRALDRVLPVPVVAGDAFDAALAIILRHEGGWSNHSKDPGGMTNFGITKNTLEGWLGRAVTEKEMRALTPASVAPIYRKNYWDACRCDDLHPALALCVFDFAVNAGPARAVRYLQRIVGAPQDGMSGPVTIAAAKAFVASHGAAEAVRQYSDARRAYYRQLGTFATFGRGWLRRVDETETAALRYT